MLFKTYLPFRTSFETRKYYLIDYRRTENFDENFPATVCISRNGAVKKFKLTVFCKYVSRSIKTFFRNWGLFFDVAGRGLEVEPHQLLPGGLARHGECSRHSRRHFYHQPLQEECRVSTQDQLQLKGAQVWGNYRQNIITSVLAPLY